MGNPFERMGSGKKSQEERDPYRREYKTLKELNEMSSLEVARYFAREIGDVARDLEPVLGSMDRLEKKGDKATWGDFLRTLGDGVDFAAPRIAEGYKRYQEMKNAYNEYQEGKEKEGSR